MKPPNPCRMQFDHLHNTARITNLHNKDSPMLVFQKPAAQFINSLHKIRAKIYLFIHQQLTQRPVDTFAPQSDNRLVAA